MHNKNSENLLTATQAILSGNREDAVAHLENELLGETSSTNTWLLYALNCESLAQAEEAIGQAKEQDPESELAAIGERWFSGLRTLVESIEAEAEAEAEAQRIAEEEAEAQRVAEEAEAQRIAEEEAEARRVAEEAEAQRIAEEEAEAEARRVAEEDAKAARIAEEERLAEEEAEAQRQAEEAEEQRQAEEAEAQRLAEEEAEQRRKEAKLKLASTPVEDEIVETVNDIASDVQAAVSSSDEEPDTQDTPVKPCVLAVDDSPTIRKLVTMTLSREGFEVISAADGVEALTLLGEREPDVILSDINMPRLGGYKLCKFVKRNDGTKHIPVILLSGKDGVFDKMRGRMSGCDGYITKPFESNDLLEKVRKFTHANV